MWHAKNLPLSSRQAHKLVTSLSLPSWISSWATLEKGDSANQPTSKTQKERYYIWGQIGLKIKLLNPIWKETNMGLKMENLIFLLHVNIGICSFQLFIFSARRPFIARLSLTMIERVTSMINWMIYCLDWPLRNPIWGLAWIQIIVIR